MKQIICIYTGIKLIPANQSHFIDIHYEDYTDAKYGEDVWISEFEKFGTFAGQTDDTFFINLPSNN